MTQDIRFAYSNRMVLNSARNRLAEALHMTDQAEISPEAKAVIAAMIECADDAIADCLNHGDSVVREMIPVKTKRKAFACTL